MRDELIFWFNIPPKVEKGAFNYVSEHWPSRVYYIILNDLPEYRKLNHWDDNDFGNAEVIKLWEKENADSYIQSICRCHPSAIHILNGFTNSIQKKVRRALKCSDARVGVYTERPSYYGGFPERLLRRIGLFLKYYALRVRDEKVTDFVLPLGKVGVQAFESFGWDKEKLFPFMYNPQILFPAPLFRLSTYPIRFVYVGRFYFKTKGIDVLMKACELLTGSWTLDLVGGYGKDKDKVLDWIQSHEQVHFLGNWQSEEVVSNLQKYDVVIVPSKCDGWNLLVNEAIAAGVGCISSDESVSHELIQTSGAGIVYHWNRSRLLAKHMQSVIDDPTTIQRWKENALNYRQCISPDTVGKYLISILDSLYYREEKQSFDKPTCPWV